MRNPDTTLASMSTALPITLPNAPCMLAVSLVYAGVLTLCVVARTVRGAAPARDGAGWGGAG
eukprot:1988587-Rhodomonas_salina.1